MPRLPHGMNITPEALQTARDTMAASTVDIPLGFALAQPLATRRFDFLFLELQDDPDNLLPEARKTRNDLVKLGEAMADRGDDAAAGDSTFSAAYTYFGQFVDHDITFETSSAAGAQLVAPDLTPLPLGNIRQETQNLRTGALDLDSVYGLPAPLRGTKMRIGEVTEIGGTGVPFLRPPNKDDFNDLPRERRSVDILHDRAALIGDPRNDENLIISQLHLAFLRAHNELVDRDNSFRSTRRLLRQHYQHIVLHDFLKQIAEPSIVDDIIENGNRIYDPGEDEFFMPLEFSVATYRFGHSMVRARYNFNLNFPGATLDQLFTFTALAGELGGEGGAPGFDSLPDQWIIQWEKFFRDGEVFNKARKIDTQLVEPLEHLQTMDGQTEPGLAAKLAVRNLLRGYQLRMPTGQAVGRALGTKLQGVRDIPVLSPQQIKYAAASDKQREVLENSGFDRRTPLWYYILAEAALLRNGRRLGPVGSTIVAEVLVGLVRRSANSILHLGNPVSWEPTLPSEEPGTFTLADLLTFASAARHPGRPGTLLDD